MIPGLAVGRMVHFTPSERGDFKNFEHSIAGVVVRVWDAESGLVNLRLFLDGGNDHHDYRNAEWVTSVPYDPTGKKPHSWRFPPRV